MDFGPLPAQKYNTIGANIEKQYGAKAKEYKRRQTRKRLMGPMMRAGIPNVAVVENPTCRAIVYIALHGISWVFLCSTILFYSTTIRHSPQRSHTYSTNIRRRFDGNSSCSKKIQHIRRICDRLDKVSTKIRRRFNKDLAQL